MQKSLLRNRQATPRRLNAGLGTLAAAFAIGSGIPAEAAADSSGQTCPDASLTATQDNLDRIDDSLLCLINSERQQGGVAPLSRSAQLNKSASFQSADMVAHHYFAHDYSGRPSLLDRVLWSGYFEGATTGLYAENLLNGPQETTTPTVMIGSWMDSPDHRSNILDPRLHDIGLGTALAPPDPAFYPDRPAVVVTTDFGVRVFGGNGCNAPPASNSQPSSGSTPAQQVCIAPHRSARRRRHTHRRRVHRTRTR